MSDFRIYLELRNRKPVERFDTLKQAVAYYEELNLRLVTLTDDCAEFVARAVETRAETRDGRTFHEMHVANMQWDTTARAKAKARSDAGKRGGAAKRGQRATHCGYPGCTELREEFSHHVLCKKHRQQKDREAKRKAGKQ